MSQIVKRLISNLSIIPLVFIVSSCCCKLFPNHPKCDDPECLEVKKEQVNLIAIEQALSDEERSYIVDSLTEAHPQLIENLADIPIEENKNVEHCVRGSLLISSVKLYPFFCDDRLCGWKYLQFLFDQNNMSDKTALEKNNFEWKLRAQQVIEPLLGAQLAPWSVYVDALVNGVDLRFTWADRNGYSFDFRMTIPYDHPTTKIVNCKDYIQITFTEAQAIYRDRASQESWVIAKGSDFFIGTTLKLCK